MARACPNPACGTIASDDGAAFCARCGAPLSALLPRTMMVPSLAPQWAPSPERGNRTSSLLVVSMLTAALVVGGGVVAYFFQGSSRRPVAVPAMSPPALAGGEEHHVGVPAVPSVPAAAPVAPPADVSAPILLTRAGWLSSVHYRSPQGVDLHAGDLDGVDGHCVRLTGAMLTIELPGGDQFVSDGNPQRNDIELHLASPGSGAFDLDIGVGHNRFVPVEGNLSGDQRLDLDHLGVRVGRFVRISTRRTGGSVCVDAVSVSRAVPGAA
jgi:hypothetical protein